MKNRNQSNTNKLAFSDVDEITFSDIDEINLADIEELRAALGAEADLDDAQIDTSPHAAASTSMCADHPWDR